METYNSLDNLHSLALQKLGGDGWYILQSYTGNTFEKWTPQTMLQLGAEYAGVLAQRETEGRDVGEGKIPPCGRGFSRHGIYRSDGVLNNGRA
ncbi:MAG: hypothetical protein ACKV2U_12080, partial [Bryobacteraceae bacterium]